MENPKNQLISRIKEAANVLVTVSANPSVDQLSAAIGLSLFLNKLGKHATAVYSGATPPTLDFLQPDKTLEKTTDSLRDFIISLDKSKADKLRYKVEDQHVKIFITPYHTSISDKDLEFSQGDFNVDVVVALGVQDQKELDQAITAHGRILHDATVVSVTNTSGSSLGGINWVDGGASSLSEMVAGLTDQLKENSLDGQMATAFLTGIVAETARFSNEKTTSATMSISAKLMAAGANQQLVATQLQPKPAPPPSDPVVQAPPTEEQAAPAQEEKPNDGSLLVEHESEPTTPPEEPTEPDEDQEPPEEPLSQIHIDKEGYLKPLPTEETVVPEDEEKPSGSPFVLNPPSMGGTLTASGRSDDESSSSDPLSLPPVGGSLLSHDADSQAPEDRQEETPVAAEPAAPVPVEPPAADLPMPDVPAATTSPNLGYPDPFIDPTPQDTGPQTLADIEQAVDSPHVQAAAAEVVEAAGKPPLDEARDAVMDAINANPNDPLEPVQALNAQPVNLDLSQDLQSDESSTAEPEFTLPPSLVSPDEPLPQDLSGPSVSDPSAPPPVPPPMMPPLPGNDSFDPYSAGLPPLPDEQPPQDKPDYQPPSSNPSNPFNLPPA